jgi:hypothetical protein
VGKQAPLNSKDYRWVEVASRINKTDRDGQLVAIFFLILRFISAILEILLYFSIFQI